TKKNRIFGNTIDVGDFKILTFSFKKLYLQKYEIYSLSFFKKLKKDMYQEWKKAWPTVQNDEIAQRVFTEKRFQKEDRKCRLEKAFFIEVKRAAAEKVKKEILMENIGLLKKCNKSLVDRCSNLNTDGQLEKKKGEFLERLGKFTIEMTY
ncbi:hypothetical protein RFI_31048, partial [Reticulomyxa filosa]